VYHLCLSSSFSFFISHFLVHTILIYFILPTFICLVCASDTCSHLMIIFLTHIFPLLSYIVIDRCRLMYSKYCFPSFHPHLDSTFSLLAAIIRSCVGFKHLWSSCFKIWSFIGGGLGRVGAKMLLVFVRLFLVGHNFLSS